MEIIENAIKVVGLIIALLTALNQALDAIKKFKELKDNNNQE